MKVFEPFEDTRLWYPEDMEKILAYLNSKGTLLVSNGRVQELYGDFSEERYCASWMGLWEENDDEDKAHNEILLREFYYWLTDYDE